MAKTSVKGAVRDALREDTKARKALATPSLTGVATSDSFANFAHKLGFGADNMLSSSTYTFNPISRDRTKLEWMHRGSWLAGLAVDIPADDMTRMGIDYKTELEPKDMEQIDQLSQALDIWAKIAEVIRWGRLYGGALGVHLIDGQDPREPLRVEAVGAGQYKGLLVLDRWQVEPMLDDLVTQYGPHLGLPRYYRVQTNAPALRGSYIHYSRVAFRHVGISLPYNQQLTENLWGISVLERLYDRMLGFDTATAGATQLIGKAYLRTLSVDGLRDVVSSGGKALEGLVQYTELMRRYQGIEGMSLIDAKDKFEGHQHQAFSGMDDVLIQLGQQLSGALQIPLVRLFGQSPSGLNSTGESDLRMYYDSIAQQQKKGLFSGVLVTYILLAQTLGIKLPPNFWVDFRSLWVLKEDEKTTIANSVTDAVTKAHDSGLISDKVAMQELRQQARVTGVFSNISRADIAAAEDQVNPPPDAMDLLGQINNMGKQQEKPDEVRPQGATGAVDPGQKRRVVVQQPTPPSGAASKDAAPRTRGKRQR